MTIQEKIRAYTTEPTLAMLALLALLQLSSGARLADAMHAEARDLLTIFAVLLGAAFALWIGIFWVSNTEFGKWLTERGELVDINDTYVYSLSVLILAALSCPIAAFLDKGYQKTQLGCLWVCLVAIAAVPSLITNTRGLLMLHSTFVTLRSSDRVGQVRTIERAAK